MTGADHSATAGRDCVDNGTGCCGVCGVELTTCPTCKGRGYHDGDCPDSEAASETRTPAEAEALEVSRALVAAPEWRWLRGCSTLGPDPGVVLVAQVRPAATPYTGCGVVIDTIAKCNGHVSCSVCEPEAFGERYRLPDLEDHATAGALEGLLDTLVERLLVSHYPANLSEAGTRWRVAYVTPLAFTGLGRLGWGLHNAHTRGAAVGRALLAEWARRRAAPVPRATPVPDADPFEGFDQPYVPVFRLSRWLFELYPEPEAIKRGATWARAAAEACPDENVRASWWYLVGALEEEVARRWVVDHREAEARDRAARGEV